MRGAEGAFVCFESGVQEWCHCLGAAGCEVMQGYEKRHLPFLCLRLNSWIGWLIRRLSKSSPPKWVSLVVALTSKIPSLIVKRDIEGSPTEIKKCLLITFLSRPYAIAAAVGSLIIQRTFN